MIDPKTINFSFSLLKDLQRSPYHAWALKDKDKPSTSEQLFSLAIECAIQEPERFDKEYWVYVPPKEYKNVKATKDYKETKAKHEEGRLLTAAENMIISIIKSNILKNKKISYIYDNGAPQIRLERKHESGINVKGFADWYCPELKALSDLKTVTNASDDSLSKLIFQQLWHVQAAIYRWIALETEYKAEHSLIIAVEYEFPYQPNVIEFTDSQLDIGHNIFMEYLEQWIYCIESNTFPSYSDDIHTIQTPSWLERKYLGD